jgi:hypothetical protein
MDRGNVKSRYRTLCLCLCLTANAGAVEHDFPSPPTVSSDTDEEADFAVALRNRTGLVEAPFATSAFPEASGFAAVLTPSAALRLSSQLWLQARVPVAHVRLRFPAGAEVGATVLGNFELALEHGLDLHASTRLGLLGALLVPTADHGSESSLVDNRALALASALNGGKEAFLLTPGASGVRLGASVEQALPPFQLRASLTVPLLIRISDASLPQTAETRSVGVVPTLDISAAWWIRRWLGASLGASLVSEAVRLQEPARNHDKNQRLQAVAEPAFHFRLGRGVQLALDASVPLGGSLGGHAWSIGVSGRLHR